MFNMPQFHNPAQFINDALQNNPNVAGNRPDGQQLINILRQGNPALMQQKAQEILQDSGMTIDQALGSFAKFFK